jgi:hypothetical protein
MKSKANDNKLVLKSCVYPNNCNQPQKDTTPMKGRQPAEMDGQGSTESRSVWLAKVVPAVS